MTVPCPPPAGWSRWPWSLSRVSEQPGVIPGDAGKQTQGLGLLRVSDLSGGDQVVRTMPQASGEVLTIVSIGKAGSWPRRLMALCPYLSFHDGYWLWMSKLKLRHLFFWNRNFYWSIVDLQCWINFCYIAKWLNYTHLYILFYIVFHYGLP